MTVAYLDLVKRLLLLEHLDPDGDAGLVVAEVPSRLARTLSSEVAERLVVRDERRAPRHGPVAVAEGSPVTLYHTAAR